MHSSVQNLINIQEKIKQRLIDLKISKVPKIIAVSKTFGMDKISPLIDYGHLDFGENKVQEALEKPVPGTGTYTIDMGDPAASNTWPPTRMEFNMKDQMARNQIDQIIKDLDYIKDEIKLLRK